MFESPTQMENLIHICSVWSYITLATACADIAGCLQTPQEQQDEDLGHNFDQANAFCDCVNAVDYFFEQGKDHRLAPVPWVKINPMRKPSDVPVKTKDAVGQIGEGAQ